jgi:hypothetical protein
MPKIVAKNERKNKMHLSAFFRLVKRKINKYDKYAKNPFKSSNPVPITIVWIDDSEHKTPDL